MFLFNVTRQLGDSQLLKIILWGYKQLQLKNNNQLFDKKLIFVVRDCDDEADLESFLKDEKPKINNELRKALLEDIDDY